MSGLLFLTSDDFQLQQGVKGQILCNSIQGFSLVLFYSTQCEHCQELVPVFKSLPGTVGGCQFGMINVSQNKHSILMSRQTNTPIKVVPFIILYINGKPYMRYQGPNNAQEITRFIIEVSQKIQEKPKFINDQRSQKVENTNSDIPAYTLGKPLCGDDDSCYFEFVSAYQNKGGSSGG
jgi:thioredoxin-like negative regulator of GroEL